MGKKSLHIALAQIYSSIYKATTIPLIYTSIFLGNAVFATPSFSEMAVDPAIRTSYSILKNLSSFSKEYQINPLYSNVNSIATQGPFYINANKVIDTFSQKDVLSTLEKNTKQQEYLPVESLKNAHLISEINKEIIFDLGDNEKGQRIGLYKNDEHKILNNQSTNSGKEIRKEYTLRADGYVKKHSPYSKQRTNKSVNPLVESTYKNKKGEQKEKFEINEQNSKNRSNFLSVEQRKGPQLRYDILNNLSFDRDVRVDMVNYETILSGRYDIISVTMTSRSGSRLEIVRTWNRGGGHVEMGKIEFPYASRNNYLTFMPQSSSIDIRHAIWMGSGNIIFETSTGSAEVIFSQSQDTFIKGSSDISGSSGLNILFKQGSNVRGSSAVSYSIELNRGNDTIVFENGASVKNLGRLLFGEGNNELYFSLNASGAKGTQAIPEMVFGSGNDLMSVRNMRVLSEEISIAGGNNTLRISDNGELDISIRNVADLIFKNGKDSILLDRGILNVDNNIMLGGGDDTLHMTNFGEILAKRIDMGSGNDSVILSRAKTTVAFHLGDGNDTIHFLEAQSGKVSHDINFGSGENLFRLDRNVYYENRILSINSNAILNVDLANNATMEISNTVNNSGLLNLNLNDNSHYRGQGNILGGRVNVRILNQSQMHTGLTTGAGNDTLYMLQGNIAGNVDLATGNNSIVLDRATMTGAGNRIRFGTGTSTMELINSLSFLGATPSILMENGTYNLTITDLNMDRNIADISMTGRGNNTVTFHGTIARMGEISTGDGNSSVIFDGSRTINTNMGTISMGSGQDIVRVINGSVMENFVNLGSSGNGVDSVVVEDTSRIARDANFAFTGSLHFTAKDNSVVDSMLNIPGKATVFLQDRAHFNNGITLDTEEKVYLTMKGNSVFDGDINVAANKAITFEVNGQEDAIINNDIVTGVRNDFVAISLSDNARIVGSIMTGTGNDTLQLHLESALGINGLDMGEGDDSVAILGGMISGTTRSFVLGTGNNTVSILGDTTINGGIMIDIPAINNFLIDNGNKLSSDIFTGVSEGILDINRGGILEGTMNGATKLTVNVRGNSTITGNISSGTEKATVLLEQSFVGGSVESNQGGDLSFIARNSTVNGGITSTALGAIVNTNIEMVDSLIKGSITSEDITLSSLRSTLEGTLRVQGESIINLSNSNLKGGISTSVGNATIKSINSVIEGGISISRGEHTIELEGGTVQGGIVFSNSTATIISKGVAIDGNITFMPSGGAPYATRAKGNSISIFGGSVNGSILGERNIADNEVSLVSTKISGGIHLGLGDNTLRVDNTQIDRVVEIRNANIRISNGSFLGEGIRFEGMSNTVIQDSTINGTLDFSSKTLGTQIITLINSSYKGDLLLGNALNTFTLQNVTTTGNIYGGRFSDSLSLISSTIYGDIQLGSEQDTLSMSEGTKIFGKEIRSNTINIQGDVIFKSPVASNFVLSSAVGIDGKILFSPRSSIILNPGIAGDNILVEGIVENTTFGASFQLDTNFYTAETDSIRIGDGTEIKGNKLLLQFIPSHTIDGSKKLTPLIKDVIMTDKAIMESPGVIGGAVAVGGYLYNFVPNEHATGWNLEIGGKNPANGGYAATVVSNKNYSRVMWENIGERVTNGLLGRGTLDEKGAKNWNDMPLGDHFSVWSNVQISINSINGPGLPNMSEKLLLSSAGMDIKNLDSNGKDRFSVSIFGAYGSAKSDLQHLKTIKFSSELEAFSGGVNLLWENLRGKKEHRLFMTAALWGDMYMNTLFSPYTSANQSWNTYAMNASVGIGYRMVVGQFSFIPQAELLYTYAMGHELIAEDKSLIIFQEEQRLVLKTGAVFAYNLQFGIKPYIRVGLEIPVASISKNIGTSVAGEEYKYDTDTVLTRMGLGINYTVQVSGLEINTFIDTFMHMGREEGVNANIGISVGF